MLRHLLKRVLPSLAEKQSRAGILQSRGLKEDTGIVGLAVDPNARTNLRRKLNEVLDIVKIIPKEAEYRKQVELIMHERLKAVDSDLQDEELEGQLGNQLESLICQCDDELGLIPKMAEWKPWDVPPDHKIEMYFEEDVPPSAPPQTPSTPPPPPPSKT